ncbi:MAG: tetratricopeptide repeat protein [Hyphomicrobiales bacterium]
MEKEYRHGTVTLARLFAAQGHWEKAAEIYRSLLEHEPDREDLAQALSAAQQQLAASGRESARDLVPLFRRWIDLLLKYDRLRKLKRLRKNF